MNTSGDAAEQIVRMSLEGFEVAAKITGAGAKNIAVLLYAILKEEKKTKGKARLTNMLRSGKELKVFTVRQSDLKKFTQEAKKYGVLYCVLTDRQNKDPNAEVDVIARAEDASKINRIKERFDLAAVDTASIVNEAEKSKETKTAPAEPEMATPEKAEKDKLLDELMGKPIQKEESAPNPSVAKTEKSPLSEPTSEQRGNTAEGITKRADKLLSVGSCARSGRAGRRRKRKKRKTLRRSKAGDPKTQSLPPERRSISSPRSAGKRKNRKEQDHEYL